MRRLLILLLLVAVWLGQGSLVLDGSVPATGLPIAGVGLGLLLAIALGELFADVGLPRLTGYLLAGLVLGPLGLGIITTPPSSSIRFIQDAALGILALQAGHALDLGRLKQVARPTLEIALTTALTLVLLGGAVSFLISPLVPGLDGTGFGGASLALLTAVMLVCASPVVTVAVMRDAGASGRFTDLALAMTFALDLMALALMGLAVSGVEALMGPGPAVAPMTLAPLHALGWSILAGALLCGLFLVAGLWTRSSHGLTLLVLVAGAASVVHGPLHAEPVLTFATAGILARNLGGDHQRAMLGGSLGQLHLPAALAFFAPLGAHLLLPAHHGLLLAAGAMFLVRAVGLYIGSRLGAAWAGEGDDTKRHLWLALVPQGGASIGFLAMAAVALPGLGRSLTELVGAILVLNLALGPIGLKIALHRAGALHPPDDELSPEALDGEAEPPSPAEADIDDVALLSDPLQELVPPEDPDLEMAWEVTRGQLEEVRTRVREEAVTPRLERVGKVLRSTAGQARHSLQVASEACGREETTEGLRRVLQEHRNHLATQLHKVLMDLRPPASAEDVPMAVHIVARMADDLVGTTTAEVSAMETERHTASVALEPPWIRMGKIAKRAVRAVEHLFGRLAPMRQVPYRRIVRRVLAGELVAELDILEVLIGRAEFKVLRRMETLLRRADEALGDAMAEVDAGHSPEDLKVWLQERQADLREASHQAMEDEVLLEEEPLRRLSETMARALSRVARLSDDAGTFMVGEIHLRFASVAPGARASTATAEDTRQRWRNQQQALIDRMVLWARLIQLQGRLRELAFHDALGPTRRMHGRLGELLRDAQSRVGSVLSTLQGPLDEDGETETPVRNREQGPQALVRGLVEDLNRRVARPVEGIAHRVRSGAVVDRLLAALDTVTGPLPAEMLLLPEAAIFALDHGHDGAEAPMVVEVRRVSRAFFDRNVAVSLAEHMRALEVSADQAVGGVRDAVRLLEFELSREVDDVDQAIHGGAEPGSALTRAEWVETLQAVVERLGQEIAQTGETSAALQHEVSETESRAVGALWEQLQEETSRSDLDEAVSGFWRLAVDTWGQWMQSRVVRGLSERMDRVLKYLGDLRGDRDGDPEESVHGPARIRQELQRFHPKPDALPYVYGKLFSLQATENEAFIVEREREVECVRQRVLQATGGGLVIVGDRGCGRTSLLRVVLSGHVMHREVLWLDADRPFDEPQRLLKWVGRSAGMKGHNMDLLTVAAYLRKRDKVLVIDGLEHLLDRSAGGLDALDTLAELMTATRRSVTWLATAERGIWSLLQEISPVADLFDEVVYLKPLTVEGISLAIHRRHALSGLSLKFTPAPGWKLRNLVEQLTRTPPERGLFRWIAEESQGNPRAALHLWTLSLERETERILRVLHGRLLRMDMLATLPLRFAPVLLLCMQHGMLDIPHLHRAMGWSRLEAQTALNTLNAMGLITNRPRSDGDITWEIPAEVEAVVHRYLCQRGLLRPARRMQ